MRGSEIAAAVLLGLGLVTSFCVHAAESWVNLAASANGDYRSALDTDSFEEIGTNSWAVWVRLEYSTTRRDALFSPSYKTDLRRYLVRCGERTIATIQRTSLDDEGNPVRQERWPESKWQFNAVGPRGGTNAIEFDAICTLGLLPLRRLDFSRSGEWRQIAPGYFIDPPSVRSAPPLFFFRTLMLDTEGTRINDQRRSASVAYWVGDCQKNTGGIYALGSLGDRNQIIGSHVSPINGIKMDSVQAGAPNSVVFSVACATRNAPANADSEKARNSTPTSGSGFYVTQQGHLLTNAHVVTDCKVLTVRGSDRTSDTATVLVLDKANDLALLKTGRPPDGVALFRDTNLPVGEPIFAFGFPLAGTLASGGSFSSGTVSASAGVGDDTTQIQISAPVQPGNSGGPLLDRSGRVAGVVVGKLNAIAVAKVTGDVPQNVNFAIKHTVAVGFLNAHDVTPTTSGQTQSVDPSVVAARAKASTVYIECQR